MVILEVFRVPVGWGEIFKRTARESLKDNCLGLAAELAYYFFLALFPALLFLVALASFFPARDLIDQVMTILGRFAPREVLDIVREQLVKIASGEQGGLLTLGMLFTIWSTSSGMAAIIDTLNRAYGIQEGRPWWKVRLTAILLTIALAVFILASFALVLAGPALGEKLADWLYLGVAFERAWKILQWPLVFALVSLAIGMTYYFAPDAEQDWIWLTPGSVLATLLWLLTSLGFKFYITNFGSYNETYGAIGAVIVLLLWFYLSGLAILIGAELNSEIEHASPYGKDAGEKRVDEKKKIGLAAARAYEDRLHRMPPWGARALEANCSVDRRAPGRVRPFGRLRFSNWLLGGVALAPMLLALGRRLRGNSLG